MVVEDLYTYHNKSAEKSILGVIYTHGIVPDMPAEWIYNDKIRRVVSACIDQSLRTGSIPAIETLSNEDALLVSECIDNISTFKFQPLIEEVRRAHRIREFSKECFKTLRIISNDTESADEIAVDAIGRMAKIATYSGNKEYDHVLSSMEFLNEQQQAKQSGRDFSGMSTQIPKLDKLLGGWQRKKTYVVGGLEKLGKTRFVVGELISNWLNRGHAGIFFSLEATENDVHEMIIANRCNINTDAMGTGSLVDGQISSMEAEIKNRYSDQKLYIDTTSSVTISHIKTRIRRQKQLWGDVEWIAVDYIQRMVSGDDRVGKLEDVAKSLADIGRDENVCVVVISQLSAEAEKNDFHNGRKLPVYAFIKGSKGIREAADAIIVFDDPNRGEPIAEADRYEPKEILAYILQRKGPSDVYVKLVSQRQYAKYREGDQW